MKYSFSFSNLCGSVYKTGNVEFSPDGNSLFSPVGNRVTVFQLVEHTSRTLDFETRSDIQYITISPDGRLLVAIDVDGYAVVVNANRGVVLHRFNFKSKVRAAKFSPCGKYLAVTNGKRLQVWRTPTMAREFTPFVLHRIYTGHYDDIVSVDWSPNSEYILTGSKDLTARLYSRDPIEGFIPVTLGGHRERIVSAYFAESDTIYTISRDGTLQVWVWEEKEQVDLRYVKHLSRQLQDESGETDESGEEGIDDDGSSRPKVGSKRKAYDDPAARLKSVESLTVLASRVKHVVPSPFESSEVANKYSVARGQWTTVNKFYLKQSEGARITSASFLRKTGLLILGLSNGTFSLYTLPGWDHIHSLSMSMHQVDTCAINSTGDWVAFGSRKLGQLLVWEWASESYILKQQGHYYDVNCVAYSPNGQIMATGGEDGKVKVWNTTTGFCFVTFSEHSAPITGLTFIGGKGGHGLALLSCSLDGTVRAFDLVRYRNFRTFSAPGGVPVQFTCLTTDEAGELVCAGGMDPFNIYVWSLQTGKLLDTFTGHEAPISSIAYSPATGILASASWDKTVRLWDLYRTGATTETFTHGSDVLAVAFRPDGEQLAASTMAGQICIWDVKHAVQIGIIDGKRDASGGRKRTDAMTAANSASNKHFTTLAYSADGEALLAGGRTKYICLYAANARILLRKYQISHNRSLDGLLDKLHSKQLGEGGIVLSTIDHDAEHEADYTRAAPDETLPGVQRGDMSSKRKTMPEVRAKGVSFAPNGRSFAVATSEGLLIYSLNDSLVFDPFELDEDVTPESVTEACEYGQFARAMLMALHLNEKPIIEDVLMQTPLPSVHLVACTIPTVFLSRLLEIIAEKLSLESPKASPHLDFFFAWALALLQTHGSTIKERISVFGPPLRAVQKAMLACKDSLGKLANSNQFLLDYLALTAKHAEKPVEESDSPPNDEEDAWVTPTSDSEDGFTGADEWNAPEPSDLPANEVAEEDFQMKKLEPTPTKAKKKKRTRR